MLEPDSRHLLLDALRPPSGFRLDLAIGTTYSLDLLAFMTVPVAFAMFDRQGSDGSTLEDPIAMLQALREYAARITLFCQAGQIAIPPDFRSLLVYLEDSVYPVIPPRPDSIFHPKVWCIRFRHDDEDEFRFRLLCMSRNLTFDRSWDTILRLDGSIGDEQRSPELARFAESLITMAEQCRPAPPVRADAIRALGYQFSCANWELPDNFDHIRFWPLGDDPEIRWPFEGRRDRTLVVSPFVTKGALSRLTKGQDHAGSILVSRPESIDALGRAATRHLAERLVLSADASALDLDAADVAPTGSLAESAGHQLEGLHAKIYVADAGWRARVWTGSANATDAAFNGNVEFLVELGGKKDRCGVHATIGDEAKRLGLRRLVESYESAQDETLQPTAAELIEQRLDRARRAIGGLRFTVACQPVGPERWQMALQGEVTVTSLDETTLDGITATIRPISLNRGSAISPTLNALGIMSIFDVSETSVTPYFAFTLSIGEYEIGFLIAGELISAPPGRTERVLSNLLRTRADLLRFLLLLLGNTDEALAGFGGHLEHSAEKMAWLDSFATESLLEPLVRAYSRDPQRLRDIELLLAELGRNAGAESILPERWDEIWGPIAEALVPANPS